MARMSGELVYEARWSLTQLGEKYGCASAVRRRLMGFGARMRERSRILGNLIIGIRRNDRGSDDLAQP